MSCDITGLCGISSRFQLLSPCTRQVAHALLTRPPLSHKTLPPEGFRVRCFVRLGCVRHAASVHPEPGSNSQIKFVLNRIYVWHNFASLFWFSLNRARSFIRNHLVISDCFLENLIVTALQSVFEFSRLSNYPIFKVRSLLCCLILFLLFCDSETYLIISFDTCQHFF